MSKTGEKTSVGVAAIVHCFRLPILKYTFLEGWAKNPNLCYFQTMRPKVLSLIDSPRKAKKEAKLAAA